ncbi:MAG: hypothetical protein UU88_C0003G0040 [Parcubacteria group bacterium GW2011_GWC1_42_11]|uniref:Uncharacterized protein n=1 Tax=Candidatus Nomurabacteria bacterium GW2011_GWC2_42_20 TaxID=1618756 RepID=A0A0G0ZI13_9BACT|nr:MAG: hypothetical protein UU88_C0003G0040 [Parcubacteria group bacterium GW2011_GWC1_42_11]KKS48375.1 MAG: hypothetical protein UV12_C0001G0070 [Candidatus Nomurabacteria bacterium GW2011_GWC2_42_20]KKS58800.1 MAG: hypothetical protein UV24_C0016G0006 [Candidatus Nomurabacteria bacterium GW2011_GWA2_42_41]KKT09951.1 MAG: hypothetical protein UV86_C0001G0053 [Candidatus Nomurabacteria bacterium GW2011_GWB1_43_20]TAN36067.1 MAG: hypothetical protein EPN27_02600 [Patescibacteria group bacterium
MLIIFIFFSFPVYAASQPLKNVGFVPANIWFSKDPFFDGEKIRIYTIVFNGSSYALEGTVEFLDNGVFIGKTNFSLSSGGRVRDMWIDWEATKGKHAITARIVGATASSSGGAKSSVMLDNTETGKSVRDVDMDSDGDDIGDRDDLDDDGDGISDVDELRNGTDPLKKDTDGDGISDDKELEILLKDKAEAELILDSASTSVGTILHTLRKIDETIPEPIKTAAITSTNIVERFRVEEGYKFALAKDKKLQEIKLTSENKQKILAQENSKNNENDVIGNVSNATKKPFAYAMLASLAVLEYTFKWKVVFYGILLYTAYRMIMWLVRRVRDR